MPEETRPTPTSERITPEPSGPSAVTTHQTNGQPPPTVPSPPAAAKVRAWGLRFALSASLFVGVALLTIGLMTLFVFKTQTAISAGLLVGFIAAAVVYSYMPTPTTPTVDAAGRVVAGKPESLLGDLVLMLRWLAGLCIVLLCGWIPLGVTFYVFREHYQLAELLAAALSFGAFYMLERDLWLSRFMGLHVAPNASPLMAAFWLWIFGVAGLLMRSTLRPETETTQTTTREKEEPQQTDSVREVIETVVFVVVLVLLLKSFVAEAFVIPTGSMAETLFGYQRGVTCPECGYFFPVNVSQEVDPTDETPTKVTGCTCPNCRYHIEFERDHIPDTWSSGDRVLVGKYFYELVDLPERLDVVVFKYPGGSDWPHTGPNKNHVPLNYIKRLIGKPGETIAIYRGKIYVLSPELSPHWDDWEKAQHDPELMARLWQVKYQHVNDEANWELFKAEKFTKLRKPPDTMLAMSRNVFDNDHQDPKQPPRWQGWDGWKADPKENGFSNPGGATKDEWLQYRHLVLRDKPEKKTLITDFMGYNTFEVFKHSRPPGENWVGDLLLECEVTLDSPTGELVLELSKSHHRYQARWDLTTGDCHLFQVDNTRKMEKDLGTVKTPVSGKGKTYRLRFADVDGKLTVWVDGTLPFGDDGVLYESDFNVNSGPTENDLEPASIGIKSGAVKVRKLRLLRDTYYTTGNNPENYPSNSDYDIDFGDPDTWGRMDTLEKSKVRTIYVQPGHYLCMGDNSPESSDGRTWGCVPERLMLGRAMLVYYPFNRAGKIR